MSRSQAITFQNALSLSVDDERRSGRHVIDDNDVNIPLLQAVRDPPGGLVLNLRRHFWRNAILFSVAVALFAGGLRTTVAPPLAEQLPNGALLAAGFVFDTVALLGAIIAPPFTARFGCKRAALIAIGCGLATLVLSLYPSFPTAVPAAAIAGLAVGSLYVAHWAYLARLSALCSDSLHVGRHQLRFRAFAISTAIHQGGVALGWLVEAIVVAIEHHVQPDLVPTHFVRLTLVALASLMVLSSVLVLAAAVDPLSRFTTEQDERGCRWGATPPPLQDEFRAWLQLLRSPLLALMVPTALLLTGCDFFWMVDFNKTYMNDLESAGLIEVLAGLVGLIPAFLFAWFNDRPGRTLPSLFANIVQILVLLTLGSWHDAPNSQAMAALYSSLWFFASATRSATFLALLVIVFPMQPEDVFATMLAWSFIGRFLLLACSTWLPLATESAILIALLVLSVGSLIAFEIYGHVVSNRTLPFVGSRRSRTSGTEQVAGDT